MYGRCHKVTALRDSWQMEKKKGGQKAKRDEHLSFSGNGVKATQEEKGSEKKPRGEPGRMMKYIFFKRGR